MQQTIEIEVPEEYINSIINTQEIFNTRIIGYWAYGHRISSYHQPLGWLVVDHGSVEYSTLSLAEIRKVAEDALRLFRDGLALPKGVYILNRDSVARMYVEGYKMWGQDWTQNNFYDRADQACQKALLGAVFYG